MAEAARITGRSRDTVRRWRSIYLPKLKPKVGRPRRDLAEPLLAALGTASDADVARQFNLPKTSIRNYRVERDIPVFRKGQKVVPKAGGVETRVLEPTEHELSVIKSNTLLEASSILGRSRTTLRRWRCEYLPDMEVPKGRRRRGLSEDQRSQLGSASDAALARRFSVPERVISQHRKDLGLPVFRAADAPSIESESHEVD